MVSCLVGRFFRDVWPGVLPPTHGTDSNRPTDPLRYFQGDILLASCVLAPAILHVRIHGDSVQPRVTPPQYVRLHDTPLVLVTDCFWVGTQAPNLRPTSGRRRWPESTSEGSPSSRSYLWIISATGAMLRTASIAFSGLCNIPRLMNLSSLQGKDGVPDSLSKQRSSPWGWLSGIPSRSC